MSIMLEYNLLITLRVFTIEFKQECVNLLLNQGYRVMLAPWALVNRPYNVGSGSIIKSLLALHRKPQQLLLNNSTFKPWKLKSGSLSEITIC